MMDKAGGVVGQTVRPGKYAQVERERRFLLAEPPASAAVTVSRVIIDRYLVGTRLRLRRAEFPDGRREFKLTQKVPVSRPGAVQGLITNTYLSPAEAEFSTDEEAQAFLPPAECVVEVTDDARFTGGRLVRASRQELLAWLAEYGLRPAAS
ncbi:hypothetical protein [Streptomyces sp. NPDC057257]|uniref:hypothetical protein n=1 Tax=Streptomyces sp. NPDC057257 TaxID=3346071 RepID=UPI003632571B